MTGSLKSILVPLQSKGERPPVFLVPGGWGGKTELMFVYTSLARQMGSDVPVYGLPWGEKYQDEEIPTIDQMIDHFISEIKNIQPEGPYYLVGECIGGMLMYEIARALGERGEDIAILVLMDTHVPSKQITRRARGEKRSHVLLKKLSLLKQYILEALYHLGQYDYRKQNLFRFLSEKFRIARDYRRMKRKANRDSRYTSKIRIAMFEYEKRPYNGDLHLILSADPPPSSSIWQDCWEGIEEEWRPLIKGDIHTVKVPGDHLSYIRGANTKIAATALRQYLDDAYEKMQKTL
jgi:thioesterase domain-containing protein